MKLIKSKQGNVDKKRCRALTDSGKQCSRKNIHKDGLCKQHYKIHQDSVKEITSLPGGTLKEIPHPPSCLEGTGADRWRQYCELLLEYGELKGAYLEDICILCLAEEMRRDVMKDIEEDGMYNHYESGSNINGPMVALQKLDSLVGDKRAKYWMLPSEKRNKLFNSSAKDKDKKTNPNMRSAKNF